MKCLTAVVGVWVLFVGAAMAATPLDWGSVDRAIGRQGTPQPGGVHKYSFPRSDLHVTLDGVPIRPALALGGWAAFEPSDRGAMIMGDLVLTDRELSPVMKHLIDGGVQITAVHNHLFRTSIPIFYMHIEGQGDPVRLAQTLHSALQLTHLPPASKAPAAPEPLDLNRAAIEKVLGRKGTENGGVLQFSFPRAEAISDEGMPVPPSMGTATSVNFQPTSGGRAAITGDFVLTGSEVNPVLRLLRQHGIEVAALHSHMLNENPRLYFMHFWANDDAVNLARGIRAALNEVHLQAAP